MSNKGASRDNLLSSDEEIAGLIKTDLERQNSHIHLIACLLYTSDAADE